MNYVAKLDAAMENLVRVTKEDGVIILQTDFPSNQGRTSDYNLSGHLSIDDRIHIVRDNVEQLTFREDVPNRGGDTLHQFAAFKVSKRI